MAQQAAPADERRRETSLTWRKIQRRSRLSGESLARWAGAEVQSMATFHYNRFSGESANSQWSRYIQNQSYISEIGEIVSQNRKDLQATLNAASAEQKQATDKVI